MFFPLRSIRRVHIAASALKKPARFYKVATVVHQDTGDKILYNIYLDNKKLKSSGGKYFETESKSLAYAVCQEWNSQDKILHLDRMLLTKLSFTTLDNPMLLKKNDVIENIMKYLDTDTILYLCGENEKLKERQKLCWGPILQWASAKYNLHLKPTCSVVEVAEVSEESKKNIRNVLQGYNFSALVGIEFAVESVKSVLLALAVLSFQITVEEAVKSALLEQQFQTESWGKVEWAHDVEYEEVVSRLSAGVLFAHFLSNIFQSRKLQQ